MRRYLSNICRFHLARGFLRGKLTSSSSSCLAEDILRAGVCQASVSFASLSAVSVVGWLDLCLIAALGMPVAWVFVECLSFLLRQVLWNRHREPVFASDRYLVVVSSRGILPRLCAPRNSGLFSVPNRTRVVTRIVMPSCREL